MKPVFFRRVAVLVGLALCLSAGAPALATPSYGIAMYGKPALPADFTHLPYTNPNAPQGGTAVFGEAGTYDSLNPFIVKGDAPYWVSPLTVETLLGRSWDEPFTLYGLLAQSVDTDAARSYVAFTLNPKAKFSDGHPVTVADVIWSFKTLGTEGSPQYYAAWKKVAKVEQTGPRTVKFTFNTVDRELPLILGLRPILEKAQWQGKDFTKSSLIPPIGSGPYVIDKFSPGAYITFKKNPDWWGKDLPFNRGLWNFDKIKFIYFNSGSVVFQAFKAGDTMMYRESNPVKWLTNYDFPAVRDGQIVKEEIPNQRPSGIQGLVMNTRRAIFKDWRVRQAMIDAFDFAQVNKTLNNGAYPRITSYFSNSELGADMARPASPAVAKLLDPYKGTLLPGVLSGYSLPVASPGPDGNRANLRKAARLLAEAGWHVKNGVLQNAEGKPFTFEILLVNGEEDYIAASNMFVESLKQLGIAAHITTVDGAQFHQRTTTYDFDMTHYRRGLSLSPGNEQYLYWSAAGVKEPDTGNWMGMNQPAAEAMIKTMLSSRNHADFVTAVHALDRILTAGRYVIPFWYAPVSRMAHAAVLHHPARIAIYGDWIGFMPDVWWYQK